jgi:putative ABC transport system permease protein
LKNYKQLIPIYIKTQLKYTLSIATAIIVATALIVSMLVLSKSSSRNAIERAKYKGGKHHAAYIDISKNEIQKIRTNKFVKEVYCKALLGDGLTSGGKRILIGALDKRCIKEFDYTIAKGKFPRKNNEIAIEKWMLDNLRVKQKNRSNFKS